MKKYRDVHLNTELKTEEEAELDDEDLLALDMEQGELEAAVEWCKTQGIVFDAVNAPLPEQIQRWGNDTRKIYADFYIDDKAMRVEELENIMDSVVDIVDNYNTQ